jgi:hypothetical protein
MTAKTAPLCALLLILTACSGGDKGSTTADRTASLRIIVRDTSAEVPRIGGLECGGKTTGTGTFKDPAAAAAACELIFTEAVSKLLLQGPPADRMCTQVYGGPQEARVTGTLRGRVVSRTFKRTNGCEISDWDSLKPVLGEARGDPAETPQ